MNKIMTTLSLGAMALAVSACGPSAEELQEEREASFRGKFIVSCTGAMTQSGAEPALAGNLCDCAASKVVSEIGIPEDGSEPQMPAGAQQTIMDACIAEETGVAAS